MRSRVGSALLLALVAAASHAQTSATHTVRRVGAATLQNVPEIPADVSASVRRYESYRDAWFQDWLADGSILIASRIDANWQIYRMTAPGGALTQLTFGGEPIDTATVIPGMRRFVFGRDNGGDEWFQLYAGGVTGEPVLLTEPGTRNVMPAFSPDGKLLAWSRSTKGSAEHSILVADPADPRSVRTVYRETVQLSPEDIAADRSQLILTRGLSERESKLVLLDLASGKSREIAPNAGIALYRSPRFALDGRSLFAISDGGSDFARLVQIDIASGKQAVLTPGLAWDVEQFALSEDGRTLAYSVNEDGFSRVFIRDLATGRLLPRPELPDGVVMYMAFSADGSKLGFSITSSIAPGEMWSWELASSKLTRWTSAQRGAIDPAKLVQPQLLHFKSFDGLSIPALVYRPSGSAAKTRTPVLIEIHGGPELQARPTWRASVQYFVGVLGATVIVPNVRGSSGYGKRYAGLDDLEKREDSVKDIGALLDWIATQPGLDKDRVAVRGDSYGGYMSLATMTHYADRLVGGVDYYGVSDFASFLRNTETYRRDHRRGEYGDERDPAMQAFFKRIAPFANVARITKPMLVLQGANDPKVPKSESDQVVAGIRGNGVAAWYVVFGDEGHGFQKKPNRDLSREVETLFLRGLFGAKAIAP
jgi:dipeptidyl aminopeptidase/acylaminoacyl peptidase